MQFQFVLNHFEIVPLNSTEQTPLKRLRHSFIFTISRRCFVFFSNQFQSRPP